MSGTEPLPRRKLFFTVWLVAVLFWCPFLIREHFPAVSLAESGTFNVAPYLTWCEDIFAGPLGGAYINNNPGTSLLGAIPLAVFRPVLAAADRVHPKQVVTVPAWTGDTMFASAVAAGRGLFALTVPLLTNAFVMAPLLAATAVLLASRLVEGGVAVGKAVAVALFACLATPMLFRTGYLNHNLMVCYAGLFAFFVLWTREAPSAGRAALAGLLGGYAVFCDFSGLLTLGMLGLYLLARTRDVRVLGAFVVAAVPPLAALLAYQLAAFGNPFLPSQHYMVPTAPTSQGYRGFAWPSPDLLWANFFDARFGLFAYCPVLALAFVAPFVKGVAHRLPRRETVFFFLYFAAFVLFCAANQYSWLQPTTGFRYMIPIVPGLAILTAQVLQVFPRWLQVAAVSVSALESWALASTRQHNVFEALQHAVSERLPLPWTGRMADLGLLSRDVPYQAIGYAATALVLFVLWRANIAPGWRSS